MFLIEKVWLSIKGIDKPSPEAF